MNQWWLLSVMVFSLAHAQAAQVDVQVIGRDDRPISGLVVALQAARPTSPPDRSPSVAGAGAQERPSVAGAGAQERPSAASAGAQERPPAASAVMDQVEQRFLPFILPVRTGTAVTFPNSDSIAHQVYSFSPTKRFELGLYRGRPYPPVVFDKPGIVVMGCNIHDKMVGYIYVTDASYFGKTNERGTWRADGVAPAEYTLEVWSPLLARDEPGLRRSIVVSDAQSNNVVIRLTQPVEPEPLPQTDRKVRDY